MSSIKWVILSLVSTFVFGVSASAQQLPLVSSSCTFNGGDSLTLYYGGPVLEFPRNVLKFNGKEYKASSFDQNGAQVIYTITSTSDDVQVAQPSSDSSVTYSKKSFELRSADGTPIFDGGADMSIIDAFCTDQHGMEALAL